MFLNRPAFLEPSVRFDFCRTSGILPYRAAIGTGREFRCGAILALIQKIEQTQLGRTHA